MTAMADTTPPPVINDLGFSLATAIRSRTLVVRIICMSLVALLLATVGRWEAAPLWLGAYLLVQAYLFSWSRLSPAHGSRSLLSGYYLASFINYAIAGLPVWHMWTRCGDLGQIAATLLLCGMLVQLITSCMAARMLFWSSAAPLIGYLLVVPLLVLGETRPQDGLVITACASLLLIYMTVLWMGQQRALNTVLEGRREADRLRFEAEGANQAKTDFLAVMSHEIRTPMNAVLGAARMLERGDLGPAQQAHVAMIVDAGQVLMDVLNDILDLAKIEAGKLSISAEATGLRGLVRRCAETWRIPAEAKGLAFDVRIPGDLPAAVEIDGGRTAQILFNLLSNAVKFTAAGSITVTVAMTRGPKGQDMLNFEVADTGCGIPADGRAKLFAAFEQADNSISRRFGGTGLGLAISQKLAQMMGGEITVHSAPGVGSAFALTLPVKEVVLLPAAAVAAAPLLPGRPLKILVAEDNLANQRIVSLFLEPLGAEITLVGDGIEALDALNHAAFDVVLMDMQMPQMDGLEATRRLRASSGINAAVPVIALTANVMDAQRRACHDAGMDGHVAKPIDPAELISRIAQAVAPASLAPALQAAL